MDPKQEDLELPFPEPGGDQPLIPVRMLNEHVYCPRLAYLEWVQGEWADSADTVEGRYKHRRVDKPFFTFAAGFRGEFGKRSCHC